MVLTNEGKFLHERSRKILLEYDDMARSISSQSTKTNDLLRIGTYCVFTTYFLDSLIAEGLDSFQIVQKRIPPGELEDAVFNKIVDIGISFLPYMRPGLDFLPVTKFAMGVFSSASKFNKMPFSEIPFVSSIAEVKGSAFEVRTIDGWPYLHQVSQT